MWILSTLIGLAGGLLALSSLLVAKAPNARELLAKLTPYQGTIGLVMFGWGVWELISSVLNLGSLSKAPLAWSFELLSGVADFGVGLLLGFGMISTYALRGNAAAIERGSALREKLVVYQAPLGGLAIVVSLVYGLLHVF